MRLGLSAYAPPPPTPRMPPGLIDLMEGLSRDVLRNNPPDLYQFCADHMQKLIILRAAREGRSRTMTLEEKIVRAQNIVRQRAERRRRRYDEPDRRSPELSDEEDTLEDDTRVSSIGFSPRIAFPESSRPLSQKADETNVLVGQPERCEQGTVEKDKQESKDVEIIGVQHNENNQNVEVHTEENEDKKGDEASEPKSTIVPAMELPIEESLNTETRVVNEAVIQECDELPIDNHIFESGDKISDTNNMVTLAQQSQEKSIKESTEISSNGEFTLEVKENKAVGFVTNRPSSGEGAIDKDTLENFTQPELNAGIETVKITDNKNCDRSDDPDGTIFSFEVQNKDDKNNRNDETKSDDTIDTATAEITLQDKISESVEIKSESNESILDNETEDQLDYSIEKRRNGSVETRDETLEIMSDFNANTECHEDKVTEKCNNNGTECITNQNMENNFENISGDTEKENPNKCEFEPVTIEVKAPTPLLEQEIKDEIVETQSYENKINTTECDNVSPKENNTVMSEDEESKETNGESKLNKQDSLKEISTVTSQTTSDELGNTEFHKNLLEEVEVTLMAKLNSNEDETDSSSDNYAEVKPFVDGKTSASLDTERVPYMSIPDNDIDINALAKADSTNDLIIEETTESISETNTEADERDESSNNTSVMDLETAAVTIQKVFRTFLFKSRASTLDDVSNDEGSMDVGMPEDILVDERVHETKQEEEIANVKERRTMGLARMDTVLQTVNEEKSLSLSTDDSSTLSSAATTIQAHMRGFLVRNRRHSNKTNSVSSLVNSDGLSSSQDADTEQQKSKTVLNIHIVPEGGHFMSRDESMAMSLDLPLDTSPPTSMSNLHPVSSDVSERRKLLKREDAIQSVSPPSNNSGKQSEDSGKEVFVSECLAASTQRTTDDDTKTDVSLQMEQDNADSPTKSVTVETVLEVTEETDDTKSKDINKPSSIGPSADEMDVVTPLVSDEQQAKIEPPRLLHSGEFHDVVLPTCVSRSETAVVREFKNVLGYFLIWNSAA